MKKTTDTPEVETTYIPEVYAELLALSHQATALLVKHFRDLKHINPEDSAQNRLGELAGGKLYQEIIIKMTNKQREEKLPVVKKILEDLKGGLF